MLEKRAFCPFLEAWKMESQINECHGVEVKWKQCARSCGWVCQAWCCQTKKAMHHKGLLPVFFFLLRGTDRDVAQWNGNLSQKSQQCCVKTNFTFGDMSLRKSSLSWGMPARRNSCGFALEAVEKWQFSLVKFDGSLHRLAISCNWATKCECLELFVICQTAWSGNCFFFSEIRNVTGNLVLLCNLPLLGLNRFSCEVLNWAN